MVLGEPPPKLPDRAARFTDFVEAMDVLLREPMSSYQGEFYTVVDSRTLPGCTQQPRVPFTIAAAGPRALAVAARHAEMWVTYGPFAAADSPDDWYDAVAGQASAFDKACDTAGRDPVGVRRAALVGLELGWAQESVGAWDDFCDRVDALGFTDVIVHWPRPGDPDLPGPAPEVFDEISRRLVG
jgi:alkanesulfonate monooxygenase SsuD/methylene tetrahydromethanopterin reductase-like flavin-dependent oxidoreductase (luciferase family)